MALNDISVNTIHSPITSLFDELASCKVTKKKHRLLHTAVEFSPVAKDNEENRLCNAEAASISKVIKRIVLVNSIDEALTGTKKKTKTISALNNLDLFSPVATAKSLSGNSTTDVLQPERCPPSPSEAEIADLCALLESYSHSSKKRLAKPVDVTQDVDDLVDAILTDVKPYKRKGKLRTLNSQMLAKEERNIIADERTNTVLVEFSGSGRDASDGLRIEMGDFTSSGEQDNDDELYLPSPRRHDAEIQVSFASPTPLPLASESLAASPTHSLSINSLPTPQQEVEAQVSLKSLTPSSLIMSSSPSPVYKTAQKSFFGRRRLISDESEEEEEEGGCHDDSVFYITTTRAIEHAPAPTPAATTTSEHKTQKTSTAVKRNDKASKPASDFNDFKTPISRTGTAATTARRRPAAPSVTGTDTLYNNIQLSEYLVTCSLIGKMKIFIISPTKFIL